MATDLSLSFAVENGLSINDVLGIFAGWADPSVAGFDAPIGSLYARTTGHLYQKVDAQDTGWIKFSQGLGEGVKISTTDSTSGFLNAKLLTSANLVKSVASVNGVETLVLDLAQITTPATFKSVTIDGYGRVVSGTNPTTLNEYGIVDAQPLDATLSALSSLNSTGLIVQTGLETFAHRSLIGTQNEISVQNGDGTSGNPTVSLPEVVYFPGAQGTRLALASSSSRLEEAAVICFNLDTSRVEYFTGTEWISVEAATGGTVTEIAAVALGDGLAVTGSPISTSGSLSFALSHDVAALEALTGTGISVRTGNDTWSLRSIVGTANRLAVTNGTGVGGNIVLDIASTYAGQSSISTVGTITSGTWAGTTLATSVGGTGRTSIGSSNQVLSVNNVGTALEYKSILGGTGIGINAGAGQITILNSGVTSISGTLNQVVASAATGAVTLSLPQSISTTSSPSFAQLTVAADPTQPLQVATKQYVDTAVQGLSPKQSVRVATTGNITLFGVQTIDGKVLAAGDRVLVKNQTNAFDNGIYTVSAGAWPRATDMDVWAEVPGVFVLVEEGQTQADTGWVCTSDQGGTLGTTGINWVQFSSATDIAAGTGLVRSGNTLSIAPTGVSAGTFNNVTVNTTGQVVSASNVGYLTGNQNITLAGDVTGTGSVSIATSLSATGVSAGTYRSVTVDTKGRVTAGTNPTTLAGFGIVDAQPLDSDLTALAALSSTGFPVRVGSGSWVQRSIVAGSSKIQVTDGTGVNGNPTLDVVEANLSLNSLSGTLGTAKGGTGLTVSGTANQLLGMNTAGSGLEYRTLSGTGGVTVSFGSGAITIAGSGGTVTSVAATGSTGLSVSGSPITTSGTLALTLGQELQGLSALSANGLVTRTALGTYTNRLVVSGVGTITVTNPGGTAGNIGLDLTTIGTAGTYRSVTTDAFGRVTAGTNPTTLAGYGIVDAISLSEKGAANGVATLDINGQIPTSQLPALAVSDVFTAASQAAMLALTAQRGDFAVRTDIGSTFVLAAEPATTLSNWVLLSTGATGTVTSVALTPPAAGLTVSGSPITSSGTFALSLANDLAAVEALSSTGIAVRTAADTWTTRSVVAGTGISVTNGAGTGGNITIAATNNGTVTSVGLTLPSIFTVTGTPVTSNGTLAATLASQAANTVFAAPTGASGAPTFRTLSLLTGDVSDVSISAPQANQVLAFNSTTSKWVNTGAVGANAAGLVGAGQSGAAAWSLVSGSTYQADFAHNLGTTNVVITVFNSATNAVVIPASVVLVNANTVRISVVGNALTLKVVVVANGQSIVAGGSTPSSVITAKDGVTVSSSATKINFTGQAIGVTDAGGGTTNVAIGSRFTYFANSLDNPINSDWAINALAPVVTDPLNASLKVRQFSNSVEQGVGFMVTIPQGATQVTVKMRGRAQTAPGASSVVQPRLYTRAIPNNAAVSAWSAAIDLPNIAIPTNTNFQYYSTTFALGGGFIGGNTYNIELTRKVSGLTGTNLASNFLLVSLELEFF